VFASDQAEWPRSGGEPCDDHGVEDDELHQENAELRQAHERLESKVYQQECERGQLLNALTGTIEGRPEHILAAQALTDPAVTTAIAIRQLGDGTLAGVGTDIGALATALREQADQAVAGDIDGIKRLLVAQVYLSDALAKDCIRRAADPPPVPGKPEAAFGYRQGLLEVAIKAMDQSARTAKRLVELDAPRRGHTYVRAEQANLAAGQQQVNNIGTISNEQPNQLVENECGLGRDLVRLDVGTKKETVTMDEQPAAVGEVHRSANGRRKG